MAATKEKAVNPCKAVTGKARLSYAFVWEPAADDNGQEKFSVSILVPKKDTKTIARLEKAIDAAKQLGKTSKPKWGGKIPANLRPTLHDGDEERPDDPAYQGMMYFSAKSVTRPGIVDLACNPITDKEEVYSGCYARVSVNFFPYDTKGNGVAAGLNNIQKVADGDALSGHRSDPTVDFAEDFEDDDDSFLD